MLVLPDCYAKASNDGEANERRTLTSAKGAPGSAHSSRNSSAGGRSLNGRSLSATPPKPSNPYASSAAKARAPTQKGRSPSVSGDSLSASGCSSSGRGGSNSGGASTSLPHVVHGGAMHSHGQSLLSPTGSMSREQMQQVMEMAQEGNDSQDVMPQAVEILASLASLGISPALRERVQDALAQLDQATSTAFTSLTACGVTPCMPSSQSGNAPGGKGAARVADRQMATLEGQVKSLETKLQMSRSIMRKLYFKNVNLEKEVQLLQANKQPASSLQLTGRLSTLDAGDRPTTSSGTGTSTPVAAVLQERDTTIEQLQAALDAARRRCSLYEEQLAAVGRAGGGPDAVREAMVQSQLHAAKYKQIRDDYNRLLTKRVSVVQSSKAASEGTKAVLDELHSRLQKEIQEREAEAALYSARLYESERQHSDWYVEKRMLEDHITRLNEELAQRDRLDAEIETCVCGLFERLRMVEERNERLVAKLQAAGVEVSPDDVAPPPGASPSPSPTIPRRAGGVGVVAAAAAAALGVGGQGSRIAGQLEGED